MSVTKPYIFPTYQANLNGQIAIVRERMNDGNIWGTWEALKVLYYELPPKSGVKEDCKPKFEEIQNRLEEIVGQESVDLRMQRDANRNTIERKLYVWNAEFFELIMGKLFEGGYLEKKTKEIPTNINPQLFEQ